MKNNQTETSGICKLCNTEQVLRKSHVIPDFFWRRVKKGGQKTMKGGQAVLVPFKNDEKMRYAQETYDEHMLCENCERVMKIGEDYVYDLLYRPKRLKNLRVKEDNISKYYEGVDYEKLKLFQLSILWRASVSKHEFYQQVNLSPKRNEELRQILYSQKMCDEQVYGCLLYFIYDSKTPFDCDHLILDPVANKKSIPRKYTFTFGSHLWTFYIPSERLDDEMKNLYPSRNGNLRVYKVSIRDVPFINQSVNQMIRKSDQQGFE